MNGPSGGTMPGHDFEKITEHVFPPREGDALWVGRGDPGGDRQFILFMGLCFAVNTIGAMGDVWIVLKLSRHARGTVVQDTKQGIEVWRKKEPRTPL
jgi:hypothetical protein